MKATPFVLLASIALTGRAHADGIAPLPLPPPPPPSPPPIYYVSTARATNAPVYVYDQKPGGGRTFLIAPDQAQGIINRFKDEYKKLGNPRVVIFVNRELIDESSGLKLSSHKQGIESTRTVGGNEAGGTGNGVAPGSQSERSSSTNIYQVQSRADVPLADRQTMRDVERLFGRPLRMAGVQLADQRIAAQQLGAKAFDKFSVEPDGAQAIKEREALSKVADVVLEILISSKDTTVSEIGGDVVYATPDIQATAIRLSDAKILAQATAADLIGQGPSAGRAARTFGIREIAEATALSLMEDMMQ